MLRREDVSGDNEPVLDTEYFEFLLEDVITAGLVEKGLAPVTTEGEEVEASGLLVPDQTCRHGVACSGFVLRTNLVCRYEHPLSHPFRTKRGKDGAPREL